MNEELVVLESMAACEGFLSKIKDKIASGRKSKEKAPKVKEISLEEFKKDYEPQFKYVYKMAGPIINKATKGKPNYKKALGVANYNIYSSTEGTYLVIFSNDVRELYDDNGEFMCDSEEFYAIQHEISNELKKYVGPGTKAPDLHVYGEDMGYKDPVLTVDLNSIYCQDL